MEAARLGRLRRATEASALTGTAARKVAVPALVLPPNEPREHRHDAIGQDRDTVSILSGCIAEQCRDLDRRHSLDTLAPSDGECASLIRDGDSARALCAVAANAFRSAESFIAKLRITNASISHCDEHFASDSKHDEPVMRERRCVLHGKTTRPPTHRSDKTGAQLLCDRDRDPDPDPDQFGGKILNLSQAGVWFPSSGGWFQR
jgi:hypothetical protein